MANSYSSNSTRKKRKRRVLMRRKRTLDPNLVIDYRNADVLKRFITDRGKIIPRRISGATQEQQRKLSTAIKRARFLSLIPYSVAHSVERGFAGEMQLAAQTFAATVRHRQTRPGPGEGGRNFEGRGSEEGRPERTERAAEGDN